MTIIKYSGILASVMRLQTLHMQCTHTPLHGHTQALVPTPLPICPDCFGVIADMASASTSVTFSLPIPQSISESHASSSSAPSKTL